MTTVMPRAVGVLILVFITFVWGTTFAIVKDALTTIPVPLLLALRFTVAALLLGWVGFDRRALLPAMILGLLAFVGYATQTIGLSITTASKAAFITGLSVILTPMVSAAWFRNRVPLRAFLAALVALAGLGLMTLTGSGGGGEGAIGGINRGDIWVLGTALAYALYVVYLGEVARHYRVLALASMQHWPMALLAWLWALPHVGALATVPTSTYLAILYLAVVATALIAVLQTYAQRVVPAYVAALIFVLEPVFAALFAFLLLGERLGALGWLGGALVLVAMLVSELPLPSPKPLPVADTASAED